MVSCLSFDFSAGQSDLLVSWLSSGSSGLVVSYLVTCLVSYVRGQRLTHFGQRLKKSFDFVSLLVSVFLGHFV